MQQPPSTDNTKKVIVIGDGYCGKTTLVAKITEGKFINNYHVTLGVEYGVKVCRRGDHEVRLCLWDIAGQDPFRELMPQYARHSVLAVVMCDVTRKETMYNGAKVWKSSVETSVYLPTGQPIPCVLLVNKCDCSKAEKQISSEEAFEFAQENGFVKCFETSVKDNTNVTAALEYMVDVILAYEDDGNMVGLDFADGGLKLQSYREGKKHVPTCCVGRIREDLDSENGLR